MRGIQDPGQLHTQRQTRVMPPLLGSDWSRYLVCPQEGLELVEVCGRANPSRRASRQSSQR